jgi:hypothetical protein
VHDESPLKTLARFWIKKRNGIGALGIAADYQTELNASTGAGLNGHLDGNRANWRFANGEILFLNQ